MTASTDAWFVMLVVDPDPIAGAIRDSSLRTTYKPSSFPRFGWVRDDGQTAIAAAHSILETLPEDERSLVHTAKVGRVTEVVEVPL